MGLFDRIANWFRPRRKSKGEREIMQLFPGWTGIAGFGTWSANRAGLTEPLEFDDDGNMK